MFSLGAPVAHEDPDRPRRSSFETPPPSPNFSSGFIANAKRCFSEHRLSVSMPNVLSLPTLPTLRSLGSDVKLPRFFSGPEHLTHQAQTIAPSNHRENTALHALIDSLPGLPTLSAFSFPSVFRRNPSDSEDDNDESGERERDEKDDAFKRLTGNVVVLGGYRGSILRDAKTGKRLWVPLRVGLKLRKPDLSIGLSDEAELRTRETVVPGRMLMGVGGVVSLGKQLKDKLKYLSTFPALPAPEAFEPAVGRPSKLTFQNWGYDWRRRLELTSEELVRDLEQMKKESAARGEGKDGEGEGATVFAHSMGGLMVLHALARAPDPTIFKGIIFAGTPFHGCANVLSPFRRGDGVLFNRDICSPRVVFSMRSSFYLLPRDHLCFETPAGDSLPVDFFATQSWSDYTISPVTGGLFGGASNGERMAKKAGAEKADEVGPGVAGVLAPSMGVEGENGKVESGEEEEGEVEVPEIVEGEESGSGSGGEGNEREEATKGPEAKDEAEIEEYLERTLGRVEKFHRELVDLYDPARAALYPPMCMLTSQKTPTVRGVIVPSEDEVTPSRAALALPTCYDHLLFGAGDGIVLYESAKSLPGGPDKWNRHLVGVEETTHGHLGLLGDVDAVRRCLEKLYG